MFSKDATDPGFWIENAEPEVGLSGGQSYPFVVVYCPRRTTIYQGMLLVSLVDVMDYTIPLQGQI